MNRTAAIFTLAVLAILASAFAATAQEPDEERIFTFIKGTPAKELDSALPKMRFERWLLDMVGQGVELRWSINDCGEQSGDAHADAQRDAPICAGVEAQLAGGRAFQILLTVGTQKRGIGGKPKLRSVIVQANRRMFEVKRLRDLPTILQR
jgi:hypothetical protein